MSMSAEEIVRTFDVAVIHHGDYDTAMQYAHPDFTVREAPSIPYARGPVYVGRQGLEELLEDVLHWWEFLTPLELTYQEVNPSLVVARIEGPARIKATGHEMRFLVTEWISVRDGKVSDVEAHYWDQGPLLEAARLEGVR